MLEPLHGYLSLAEKLLSADPAKYATAYNFGPAADDARPVGWIAERMTNTWGDGASWVLDEDPSVHEAGADMQAYTFEQIGQYETILASASRF